MVGKIFFPLPFDLDNVLFWSVHLKLTEINPVFVRHNTLQRCIMLPVQLFI